MGLTYQSTRGGETGVSASMAILQMCIRDSCNRPDGKWTAEGKVKVRPGAAPAAVMNWDQYPDRRPALKAEYVLAYLLKR